MTLSDANITSKMNYWGFSKRDSIILWTSWVCLSPSHSNVGLMVEVLVFKSSVPKNSTDLSIKICTCTLLR